MNGIDILIILFCVLALFRGYRIGLVRQAGSTIGFLVGLFAGSWLSHLLIPHLGSDITKSFTSLAVVLFGALIGMSFGELAGIRLKQRMNHKELANTFDGSLGSAMAVVTFLLAFWLIASIVILAPTTSLQQALKGSRILSSLDSELPPATKVLSSLNGLIDPNGFPEVFRGLEPSPSTTNVPSLGSFTKVVAATRASVVKVEGLGCGGIVEGSGFVYAHNLIATNAHVIAGVAAPKVLDSNGTHDTRVMWFDPNIDLAVLQVTNLAGKPLPVTSTEQANNTPGVVLGYPGGGDFSAQSAAIIEHFTAYGRNIYGQSYTLRDIYSLQAHIIPGNSGGPVIGSDGTVLGIVFATSTTYNNVGYALTGHQVAGELATAAKSHTTYNTGACSE